MAKAGPRRAISRESRDMLRYLIGNFGNVGITRLGVEMNVPSGPPSSPRLNTWRPYWLSIGVEVLYGRAALKRKSLTYNNRVRILNMLDGRAMLTPQEQRTFRQRLARLVRDARQKIIDTVHDMREKLHKEIMEKGSIVFDRATGISVISNDQFDRALADFLELNYALNVMYYGQDYEDYRTDALWNEMYRNYRKMSLGQYGFEWPAY